MAALEGMAEVLETRGDAAGGAELRRQAAAAEGEDHDADAHSTAIRHSGVDVIRGDRANGSAHSETDSAPVPVVAGEKTGEEEIKSDEDSDDGCASVDGESSSGDSNERSAVLGEKPPECQQQ